MADGQGRPAGAKGLEWRSIQSCQGVSQAFGDHCRHLGHSNCNGSGYWLCIQDI